MTIGEVRGFEARHACQHTRIESEENSGQGLIPLFEHSGADFSTGSSGGRTAEDLGVDWPRVSPQVAGSTPARSSMEREASQFIALLRDYPQRARAKFMKAIEDGPANTVLAERIGCPIRSLYRVLDDDPKLREALARAQAEAKIKKAKR